MDARLSRRSFLAGAALSTLGSQPARAQTPAHVPRVGVLNPGPAPGAPGTGAPRLLPALVERLHALGWIDGRTLRLEARHAGWQLDRLPALATELIQLGVDALVVMGPAPMAAAREASKTVPIVMVASSYDPVADGFVTTLGRPGGNVTGLTFAVSPALLAKQLQLLQELVPRVRRVSWIWDGTPDQFRAHWSQAVDTAAQQVRLQVTPVLAATPVALESALRAANAPSNATFVAMAGVGYALRADVARVARQIGQPIAGTFRELPEAGGLMSYGPDLRDLYRRAADYVDRILRGGRSGDMPVENPTKFEMVLNLGTAKGLGLSVPPSIHYQADDVIQ